MIDTSTDSLERRLEALLGEDREAAIARERSAFEAEVGPGRKDFVLFGAGNRGRDVLKRLRENGIEPVAFSDNRPSVHGMTIDGLPVLSPTEAARLHGRSAAFLVTIYNNAHFFPDTRHQLEGLGCTRVVSLLPLFWKYPETFLPYFRDDLPHKVLAEADAIRDAFRLWSDDRSRREFVAQVEWRLRGDFDVLGPVADGLQYFPDELFSWTDDESFVDGGAYDGDTIQTLLSIRGTRFREILALEPDPENFRKLGEYVATLPGEIRRRIAIEPLALGPVRDKVRFSEGNTTSSAVSQDGTIEVECVPLDDLMSDRSPTYIKLDIEGAEPGALAGAARTIRDRRPALAVCVYHQQDHLWRIPLQIRDLTDDCRLFLRPHKFECWETVCYAVPSERCSG